MKNICIITECSLPVPTTKGGAVETLVEYLVKENEVEKKFKFTVVSIEDEEARTIANSYSETDFIFVKKKESLLNKFVYIACRKLAHFGIYIPCKLEFYDALKQIKKLPEQDIYIYEAGPTTQLPVLGRYIPKEKLLVHLHWRGMGDKKRDRAFSYLLPVSNYIGQQWIRATKRDCKSVKTLRNCAKIDRFDKSCTETEKQEVRKCLNIDKQSNVIIYTGRIVPEKGVKELIQAVLNLKNKNTVLVIIGSANFGSTTNTAYEQEVAALTKDNDKVKFTGYVHQTELYKYYNIADIAVMPSLFNDPAPLVGIEAQASGLPLITVETGGIPEYTSRSGTILLKKDGDFVKKLTTEIDYLLESPKKRRQMGEKARQNAIKMNEKSYYKNFYNILESISREEVY